MSIFDQVVAIGVVPVFAIQDARRALPLADALAKGGFSVIEVTIRTSAAVENIRQIAAHCPNMLVGAEPSPSRCGTRCGRDVCPVTRN